ncbi:SLAM family member 8 isoform X3 [Cyanistes caeruleus]|uniref:SLAM family member 8 isoform X3 n=1 Tax=Cyanistes caeruleus TaxID=156563 RepID=UPI000CDA1DC1|nr:SLAM family member 8 isoform X3 [Cyanistes caeruleus]
MAPGSTPSFFLLLVARAWAQEAAPLEATGAVGGAALLSPRGSQNPADYSQIHWRWENRVRIAIWKRGEQPEYPQSPFQGRLELLGNHALKLGHLRRGDGGRFQLYREDDAGKESVEEFLLKVYGGHLRVDPTPEGPGGGRPRPERLLQPRGGNLHLQGQQRRVLQQRLADLPAPLQLDRWILIPHLRHAQPGKPPPLPPPPLPPALRTPRRRSPKNPPGSPASFDSC